VTGGFHFGDWTWLLEDIGADGEHWSMSFTNSAVAWKGMSCVLQRVLAFQLGPKDGESVYSGRAMGTNVIHGVRTQEELSCSRRFWIHPHLAALALLSLWRLSWIRHTIYLAVQCGAGGLALPMHMRSLSCHVIVEWLREIESPLNFWLSWHLIGRLFFMSHRRIAHVFHQLPIPWCLLQPSYL
jgi:hypothetical protein